MKKTYFLNRNVYRNVIIKTTIIRINMHVSRTTRTRLKERPGTFGTFE